MTLNRSCLHREVRWRQRPLRASWIVAARGAATLWLALSLPACAATQGSGSGRSARTLTAEEIGEAAVTTAYQAVEQLRPQWLHTRASPTFNNRDASPPALYLDGIRLEDFRELERIRALAVEQMVFMSASDATNRFGTNHMGGAILITTRGGGGPPR